MTTMRPIKISLNYYDKILRPRKTVIKNCRYMSVITCSNASAHTTINRTYALMQHQSGISRSTRVAFSKKASVTIMSSPVGIMSVLTFR